MVRGLGILITHAVGAAGAPFFGFIHDVTGSYQSSFIKFAIALIAAAVLGLLVRAPKKAAVVV
jgi:cyanate permease